MNHIESRPKLSTAEVNVETKAVEAFQNLTLRPVIKQLHSLLVKHFSLLLFTKKGAYFKLPADQQKSYIHSIFQKELRYKSELKGIIIGNFSQQEFDSYICNVKLIDKRIFTIVEERILTNQHELISYTL